MRAGGAGIPGGASASGGTASGSGGLLGLAGDDRPEAGAPAGAGASSAGRSGAAGGGLAGEGSSAHGGETGAPGACYDLVNDGTPMTEWTVDGWFLDDQFTAPLADLPGERDLHAIFLDTGTDATTGRLVRGKVRFRDVSANPHRGTFDVIEEFDDGSGERLASYAFQAVGANTARVELAWICGDRISFFENYAGALSYIVDFQVVFTREANGGEPMISRDYRTRGWVDL